MGTASLSTGTGSTLGWRVDSLQPGSVATDAGEHFVQAAVVASVVREALARGRSDAVVVGLTAAALWGMPIPPSHAAEIAQGRVALSRLGHARAWRGRSIFGHSIELPNEHLAEVASFAVATPARTWLDCAALIRSDHLLAMGDWGLERGILSIAEIDTMIKWGSGRRGVVRAREVSPLLRRGAESPQESRLRWILIENGLPEPSINPEIVLPDLTVVRIDLAYVGLRIAVEFDGDWHARTRLHDDHRRALLASLGWEIVVARKDDLFDPAELLAAVRAALRDRWPSGRRRW